MKIEILGARGEIKASSPYHSKHSGVLIDGKILLDLGEKEFLKHEPKAIFITHLHPDHAVFILEQIETKTPIYIPEEYDSQLNTKVIKKKTKIDSYTITPIPTIHSVRVKSVAYLIEKRKQKILYTGDVAWLEKKYHKHLKDLDLVITDGSFIRKGGLILRDSDTDKIYGHTGIPNLIKLFSPFSPNILFMHFGSWFYKNVDWSRKKLKKLGEEADVNLHVGYEGLEVDTVKLKKKS